MKNNIEEEKTGKLIEKPGWFRDQSEGDLKGKLSKDQNQEVKERGVTKRRVTKTGSERAETHLQVRSSITVPNTKIINLDTRNSTLIKCHVQNHVLNEYAAYFILIITGNVGV